MNYLVKPGVKNVDCWFPEQIVLEVKVADIQISPVHSCGIESMNNGKGLGLRFPRMLRERTDKKPIQATQSQQIIEFFNNQAIHNL